MASCIQSDGGQNYLDVPRVTTILFLFFFGEEEYNPFAIGEEITAACIRKQKKLQQHADEDGAEGS